MSSSEDNVPLDPEDDDFWSDSCDRSTKTAKKSETVKKSKKTKQPKRRRGNSAPSNDSYFEPPPASSDEEDFALKETQPKSKVPRIESDNDDDLPELADFLQTSSKDYSSNTKDIAARLARLSDEEKPQEIETIMDDFVDKVINQKTPIVKPGSGLKLTPSVNYTNHTNLANGSITSHFSPMSSNQILPSNILRRLPQGTRNDSSEEEEEEDDDDEEGYDSDLYDEYDDDYHGRRFGGFGRYGGRQHRRRPNTLNLPTYNRRSDNDFCFENMENIALLMNFTLNDIDGNPWEYFDTTNLGQLGKARLRKEKEEVKNCLEELYNPLSGEPKETQACPQINGLKVDLMPHQKHAVNWLKYREKCKPSGGLLADDMGLGKTLTMISLILSTKFERKFGPTSNQKNSNQRRYNGGTLVVCPASVIGQWDNEVKTKCRSDVLKVYVYHGVNREENIMRIVENDIIITTYETLNADVRNRGPLYFIDWYRIILDEAHKIRNAKTGGCKAVCDIVAVKKWALTGTPIQNKVLDLYAILKFLGCKPFDDPKMFKKWIDNKKGAGTKRLTLVMRALMLRRTKKELQKKGAIRNLPDKGKELIEIELDAEETEVYQKLLSFSRTTLAQYILQRKAKQAGTFFNQPPPSTFVEIMKRLTPEEMSQVNKKYEVSGCEILVLILRLRQLCCHPPLIHAMLDDEELQKAGDLDLDNAANGDDNDRAVDVRGPLLTNLRSDLLRSDNPVFDEERQSSKVRVVLNTVKEILASRNYETSDKLIIVSQWASFLDAIGKCLNEMPKVKYSKFTGKVAVKDRQEIVDKFNDSDSGVNVLLLSLTAGGVGLNLMGANHLLLVDLHWNPQLEAQAQDRIYRIGQAKKVHIYKFICKDTIEEKVQLIQEKKLKIAKGVLTGAKKASQGLNINDMATLLS